jgi:hypothetical protein
MTKKQASVQQQPQKSVDPAAYNQVVAQAELVTIQLRRHEFDVDAQFYNPDVKDKRRLGFDRQCLSCEYDAEVSAVAGSFRFVVQGKVGRKIVLKSAADYLVIYDFNEPVDQEAAETFCKRIGMFAAYPYYRALVSSLSAAANLDLPTLPMIATRGSKLPVPAVTGDSSEQEPSEINLDEGR